jgi:hypothetical protein
MFLRNLTCAVVALGAASSMLGVVAPADAAGTSDRTLVDHDRVVVDKSFNPASPTAVIGDAAGPDSRVSSCDTWRNGVASPGGYINSVPGCNPIGFNNVAVVTHTWDKTGGRSEGCVQGKGFNALHAPVWQNAGCRAN